MLYAIIGLPVLLLGVLALIKFRAWRATRPEDNELHHFNCPKCKRRFGYRTRQAGHKASCPRCGQNFVFPVVGASSPRRK
jgi:uncharacterized paraquat-inducible protein A